MNGTAWNDAEQRGLPDNSGSPPFYFRFRPGDWLGGFSFLPYLTSISLYSSSFSSRSSHRPGPLFVFAPEPLSGGMSVVVGLHYIRYNWASVTSSSSSIVYFTMKRPGSSGAGVTEVPMRSR